MSRKRFFSGIALAVVLAACGEAGRDPLGPGDGPNYDGGPLIGGNKSDSTCTAGTPECGGTSSSGEDGGPLIGGN